MGRPYRDWRRSYSRSYRSTDGSAGGCLIRIKASAVMGA